MKLEIEITDIQIADLLSNAFESGDVHYWCAFKEGWNKNAEKYHAAIDAIDPNIRENYGPACWLPLVASLTFYDHDDNTDQRKWKKIVLNRQKLEQGFANMSNPKYEHVHHFADFIKDNADMTTGDVFLQFAAFGEVRYG